MKMELEDQWAQLTFTAQFVHCVYVPRKCRKIIPVVHLILFSYLFVDLMDRLSLDQGYLFCLIRCYSDQNSLTDREIG